MSDLLLQPEERAKLINIVARLYDFIESTRNRRVFIEGAGLGRFISGIDLQGNPRAVASDLVMRVEKFGQLPDLPTYHSLGALIAAMLDISELDPDDTAFVAGLIVRYSLIADINKINELRQQYNIGEKAIRQPPAAVMPPSTGTAKDVQEPKFEAQIDNEQLLEQIINSEDNFLDIYLLYGALYSAQAVGRIEIPEGTAQGTGFLVGPNLLLTNQHVLKEKSHLEEAVVRFNYINDSSDVAAKGQVVKILPNFYHSSAVDKLDYALVRLEEEPLKNMTATKEELTGKSIEQLVLMGKHRGYLVLAPRLLIKPSRINIIQHPNGKPLKVVMTQNYVVSVTDSRVQYVADTMPGSSGSPVFNKKWEVVALHHSGRADSNEPLMETAKKVLKGQFRVNEGISMRAILKDFKDNSIDRHLPRD